MELEKVKLKWNRFMAIFDNLKTFNGTSCFDEISHQRPLKYETNLPEKGERTQ